MALRDAIARNFSLDEMRSICVSFSAVSPLYLDYEMVSGQGLDGKARELVLWAHRRGALKELFQVVITDRPDIDIQVYYPA
jgi:hypothetical protein